MVAHVVFPAKVNGAENAKIKEPYILCANHLSILDPVFIVGAVLHRKAYLMGKKELYKSKIGNWFFRSLLSFPVDRGTADMGAIRESIKQLNSGKAMLIFPEGTRNKKKDGSLQEFHNGVAIIALKANCKLIPCYIDSKGGYKLFHRFNINVGTPIDLNPYRPDGIKKENLSKVMDILKKEIEKLSEY